MLIDSDDYTQAGNLFRLMTKDERERLFANTARSMCRRKLSCGGFASAKRRTVNMEADSQSNWAWTRTRR